MRDRGSTVVLDVAVADPDLLTRDALSRALSSVPDIRVVAMIDGVGGAEASLGSHRPDVIVVSDSVPGQCLAMVRFLSERYQDGRVFVLSRLENEELLFAALVAGARGFASERASLQELAESLRRLVRDDLAVPPVMMVRVIDRLIAQRDRHGVVDVMSTLTPREREVLLLLTRGGNNESIAQELFISPQTARTHVQNIMTKLGTRSRLATVSFVMREDRLEVLERAASGERVSIPEAQPPELVGGER